MKYLHRNAVGVLLRTRSSSGNLRPARNVCSRRSISVPDGFNVGSPKGPPLVEHGRELARPKPNAHIVAGGEWNGKTPL